MIKRSIVLVSTGVMDIGQTRNSEHRMSNLWQAYRSDVRLLPLRWNFRCGYGQVEQLNSCANGLLKTRAPSFKNQDGDGSASSSVAVRRRRSRALKTRHSVMYSVADGLMQLLLLTDTKHRARHLCDSRVSFLQAYVSHTKNSSKKVKSCTVNASL